MRDERKKEGRREEQKDGTNLELLSTGHDTLEREEPKRIEGSQRGEGREEEDDETRIDLERPSLISMLPLPVFVAFDFGFGVEEGLRLKEWMSDRAKEPSERKGREEKDEADLDFEEILTTSKSFAQNETNKRLVEIQEKEEIREGSHQ